MHSDHICRFYSCGGDGTLNEVVSGVMDMDNVEIGCFACGTGNDFIKIFDNVDYFQDMQRVVNGTPQTLDVMRLDTGHEKHGAINICSMGVDARVADWASRNKRRLPFSGKLVYDIALIKTFFSRLSRTYRVTIDGKRYDGEYAIIVAASGRFYGGGYYAVPEAEPDDGKLDFLLVKKVSHLQLIALIGDYQNGRHVEFAKHTVFVRGSEIELETEKDEPINFDGEIVPGNKVKISVCPGRAAFVVPEGCNIIHDAQAFERIRKQKAVKSSKQGKSLV